MPGFSIDYDYKIVECECGHTIYLSHQHVFYFCEDCKEYHLHCCGCDTNFKIPQILQDYIRTYQESIQQFQVDLQQQSWQQGFQAARDHKPNQPPPGTDPLSWYSGYIEGKQPPPTPH